MDDPLHVEDRSRLILQAIRQRVIGAGVRMPGEHDVAPADLPLSIPLTVYPAWLFDQDGELIPTARSVNAELAKLGELSWADASWWTCENEWLRGYRPDQLLRYSHRPEVHAAMMQAAQAEVNDDSAEL